MDLDDTALTDEQMIDVELTVERANVFLIEKALPDSTSVSEFRSAAQRMRRQYTLADERMVGNRYRDRFRKRVERMVREVSMLGPRTQSKRRAYAVDTMTGELNAYAVEITDELEMLRNGERKYRKIRRLQ